MPAVGIIGICGLSKREKGEPAGKGERRKEETLMGCRTRIIQSVFAGGGAVVKLMRFMNFPHEMINIRIADVCLTCLLAMP